MSIHEKEKIELTLKEAKSLRRVEYLDTQSVVLDRRPTRRLGGLIMHLLKGGTVPPIHVQPTVLDGEYRILDGRHRLVAHRMLGKKKILARYSERRSQR